MTKKVEEILAKCAKELVGALSVEELDEYFFYADKDVLELKLREEIIKVLPKDGELVYKIATWDPDYKNRLAAIERIDDEKILEKIVCSDFDSMRKISAIKKIKNSQILMNILLINDELPYSVKKAGVDNINGQIYLEDLAMNKSVNWLIRIFAIEKMICKELLEKLTFCDDCEDAAVIKEAAEARLKELA